VKLSDYVIRRVADLGVRHIFMLPGGGAMHLNDSVGRCPDIEFVCNLHEQASAIAAEAYARVTNNLGVALVTTGPGGTNAVTGVAGAWLDSTPCLFLSGQVKRADLKGNSGLRQLGVQEIDIVSIVSPITKYAVTITDPSRIRYEFDKAVYLAKEGRPGPVWLDIPLDIQAAAVEPTALEPFEPAPAPRQPHGHDLASKVADVIRRLNAAQRPVVLAGNGIRLAGAVEQFRRLLDRTDIPALTTWLGIDLLADDHPLFVGRPGAMAPRGANFALQNSDWLLVLGARLDMAMIGYAPDKLARGAARIMVDVDQHEIEKMGDCIDVPIRADASAFIDEFCRQADTVACVDRSAWHARCRDWKTRYPVVLPEHRAHTDGISAYAFSEALSEELAEGELIVPGSSGFASEIFLLVLKVKEGQRVFHNRGTGAMGFGLPAALGACLASGRRRTVSVDGDGGFQLNIQELATVARLQLPIKYFVINNNGFASIRASQRNYFGRLTGADATSGLLLPDICDVARGYGVRALRISDPQGLASQVRQVLDSAGPVVCDVVVLPDEERAPRLASRQRPDGSMASAPLEDLWPFLDRDELRANMIIPQLDG
jgi:acetolactate synthase I/II/III large subunit